MSFEPLLIDFTTQVIDCGLSDSYMTFIIDCETAYIPGTDTQSEPAFTYDFGTSSSTGRDNLVTSVTKININLAAIKVALDAISDRIDNL